jgi:hypothetical protein
VVVRRRRVIRGYALGIELDHKLCHRGEWRSGAWDWALNDVQRVTKGILFGAEVRLGLSTVVLHLADYVPRQVL